MRDTVRKRQPFPPGYLSGEVASAMACGRFLLQTKENLATLVGHGQLFFRTNGFKGFDSYWRDRREVIRQLPTIEKC